MIVSVTVLGSSDGTAADVVAQKIVDYLEGGRTLPAGRKPGRLVELPSPSGGTATYYADSAGVRPGRWALGREGEVNTAEFAAYLAGIDPVTGERLISGRGSSRRAGWRGDAPVVLDKEWYSVPDAAALVGVHPAYLRRKVRAWTTSAAPESAELRFLESTGFEISRSLVEELRAKRKPPRVVAGYDLTFSVPKSVSVLWAAGDEETRTAILDALDESVAAGLRYLERRAISVRVRGESVPAAPVAAADYLHTTSRALEPQLHHHVVLANAAVGPEGTRRALDGRMLFHHAKTASFVAGAELRHQLTARLGLEWGSVANGIAEVAGVPEAAIAEMSTRSKEIAAATTERGIASARARQVAAWDTRAAKEHGVDPDALFASWEERLAVVGFGPEVRDGVLNRVAAPALFDAREQAAAFRALLRVDGITEHEPVFDRRTVVQRLAEVAGDRLSGDAIDGLAEVFLEERAVVALGSAPGGGREAIIRRDDGRVVRLPGGPLYSTRAMLALERRCLTAYDRGRHASAGVVPAEIVERVLAGEVFAHLSEEQQRFVAGLVGSGMQIQAGLGAAGTGKTTALRAAVASWDAAGYRVLGAAVGGTQAVVLAEETGVEARTVASLIARVLEHGDTSLVDARTIVLVDEASLVSTRDFAALAQIVADAGAALRLVGDPAQHTSVEAGGVFAHLVAHHPDETPTLTTIYRQQGPEMAEVRAAVGEVREGKYAAALQRLAADGRLTEADDADAAFNRLVDAWYAERQRRASDPERPRSAMTAEHHVERRELNRRARALLAADGTLSGPELVVGGLGFRAGDEVIARAADRNLRAGAAGREDYVRNGSLGSVIAVAPDGLLVDFARWGRISVPTSYIAAAENGSGKLQHAHALTTHLAQGETFALAAPLITDQSTPEGLYVAVTRAQHDLDAAVMRRGRLSAPERDHDLPALADEAAALEAAARRLAAVPRRMLATALLKESGQPTTRESSPPPCVDAYELLEHHAALEPACAATPPIPSI